MSFQSLSASTLLARSITAGLWRPAIAASEMKIPSPRLVFEETMLNDVSKSGRETRSRAAPRNPYEIFFGTSKDVRSEEHTSELQSLRHLVCRLLLENK